jgi:hypothetical protein
VETKRWFLVFGNSTRFEALAAVLRSSFLLRVAEGCTGNALTALGGLLTETTLVDGAEITPEQFSGLPATRSAIYPAILSPDSLIYLMTLLSNPNSPSP